MNNNDQTQIEIEDLEAPEDQVVGGATNTGGTGGTGGSGGVSSDTTMCGW